MAAGRPDRPTIEAIVRGDFVEDERLDFKRQLNLDETGKPRLIDDVVAFLNRGGGTILVGVEETEGGFGAFRPITGNRDKISRQVQSILLDGILPAPINIRLHFLGLDDGFILDLEIPRHLNGPFQVKRNGAFLIRVGTQNRPISPGELRGYFVDQKSWLEAAATLTREEAARLAASGRMSEKGPVLHFGIVPGAHFDPLRPGFSQDRHVRFVAPSFEAHSGVLFKGHEGGHEAFEPGGDGLGASRLLVRDDWFIHGWIARPLWEHPGEERLSLYEFKTKLLPDYLAELDDFLAQQDIEGPYAVVMELDHLQRNGKLGRYFRSSERVTMLRPRFVDRMADIAEPFVELVHRASIYG